MAPSSNSSNLSSENRDGKPTKPGTKPAAHHGFGTNMPMMSSAFDTAMWATAV